MEDIRCPRCGSKAVRYYVEEVNCGASYIDHYVCLDCGREWSGVSR